MPKPALTAIFGAQTGQQFAGILGALLAGTGFVPIDCRLPAERTRQILELSLAKAIVVDAEAFPLLRGLLQGIERPMTIIIPDATGGVAVFPECRVVGGAEMAPAADWEPVEVSQESIAYLMFTSGSTGQPKGVMVTHRNVEHFVREMVRRYAFHEQDRFTQLNSLGFDLCIMEVPVAWEVGATLCGPRKEHAINSVQYVNDLGITVWVSVPSKSVAAMQLGLLRPGAMPGLRVSAWCGEALPVDLMQVWSAAAPHSVLDNHYGPTEATCACMAYRYESGASEAGSEYGVMPIGEVYPGMQAHVFGEDMRPAAPGDVGELILAGPQVAKGYWNDPVRTAEAFIADPVTGAPAYRTGDLVRMPETGQPMTFLGRSDFQLQVMGGRIELGEVEAALRNVTGATTAVAMGWDVVASTARYLVAFVNAPEIDFRALHKKLQEILPAFAVPRRILAVPQMPLNENGKVDRKALRAMMEVA